MKILLVINENSKKIDRLEIDGQEVIENLPFSIVEKRHKSSWFKKGLKHAEVREKIISLRREGLIYDDIIKQIKKTWPDEPDKWVTKSSLARFLLNARKGKLKEFGIDLTNQ